ncbi:MAG TPA: antibiotic biosynthesis monooxygenase [Steroidobacteraceae bacterium]|nr:antibiotic biosynthesis monooxygenase [Steroidobacteraceae bacterium]
MTTKFALLSCILPILGLATAHAAAEPPQPAYIVAYVDVLASAAPRAAAALKQYRDAARRESGCVSVDVYSQRGRASGLAITEVWRDSAAFDAHGKAAAADTLRRELKPMQLAPVDVRVHTAYSLVAPAAGRRNALTLLVHVDVFPSFAGDYERLVKRYIEDSRGESGLLRLDILQTLPPHTNHFTVIESWPDEAALQSHQQTAGARAYREELARMLGALYDERTYTLID